MHARTMILTGALLLASSGAAGAQEPQTQQQQGAPPAEAPASPAVGRFDFGFRGTSLDGDEARYNRFRDLRTGPFLNRLRYDRERDEWSFRSEIDNPGYRDQRYLAGFERFGRFEATFEWDQVPLFLAAEQPSLYRHRTEGLLEIDDAVQQGIQNAAAISPAARDAAIQAAINSAPLDDLRSRRHTALAGLAYRVNDDIDLRLSVRNSNRSGSQVFAFGFGTNPGLFPAVEFGAPLDDRATDLRGEFEYTKDRASLSFGYDGSWYNNDVPFVRFDNPLRAVDIPGGPSVGQASWWPANAAFSVNANAAYTLPARTRASAGVSFGRWSQDAVLPPMTVNSALPLQPLPRQTADAQADIRSVILNLNSRPADAVWLNARYRLYDYDNETAHFDVSNAIIGDFSVTDQHHENEPSSFRRNTLDLDASFSPLDYLTVGVGYGREAGHRTFRIFEETAENAFRVFVDSTAHQFFTIRTKYEYSNREGSGFEGHLLEEVGEQPEMRHYDIANRTRSRASVILSVFPTAWLSVNGTVSAGQDDYDDSGFGLRDNSHRAYGAGVDFMPTDIVSLGVSYGYDEYTARQFSRTANPPPSPQFSDPTRDWQLDQDDTVHTFSANLDLIKALPRTDIRLGYDLMEGDATYVYDLRPDQTVFTPANPLRQLEPVKNTLNSLRADVQYFLRRNLAVGLAYWYERYRVEDFSLDEDTIDGLAPVNKSTGLIANTIYAGYLYRPYTGHTTWLRLSYLW